MITPVKRLVVAFGPSAAFAREITDALVMFSISVVAYMALANWGGLALLHGVLGVEIQSPSFLYFFGVALVLFSMRRIGDQRSERARRLAAERDVADAGDARSADAIAQPAAIPERAQRGAENLRQQDERVVAGTGAVQEAQRSLRPPRLRRGAGADRRAGARFRHRRRHFRAPRRRRIRALPRRRRPRACAQGRLLAGRARQEAGPDRHRTDEHRGERRHRAGGPRACHRRRAVALRPCRVVARAHHPHRVLLLRSEDGRAYPRTLAARKGPARGDRRRRHPAVLSAHRRSQDAADRQLRKPGALAQSGERLDPARHLHSAGRGARAPGRGVRPAVRRRLPRCRQLAGRRLADVQLLAVPTRRPQFRRRRSSPSLPTPGFRRTGSRRRSPKARWSRIWRRRAAPSRRCAMLACAS